jgi:dihydrodipicolinate synthase/N-acetylneuraminate lyase
MTDDEMKFLAEVRARCHGDAAMTERVIHNAITGMTDKAMLLADHAADMEVVAAMALNNRLFKGQENFLAQKLQKWNGRTSLRWDDQIAALTKKGK